MNVHLRKLDRETFADRPSAEIGYLHHFRLYGTRARFGASLTTHCVVQRVLFEVDFE